MDRMEDNDYLGSISEFDLHTQMYGPMVELEDSSWLQKDGWIFWYNEHGDVHREDGPASIDRFGECNWYLNNADMPFLEWLDEINVSDDRKMLLRLQYG